MDFDRKNTGDIAMAFVPQHVRSQVKEGVATYYGDYYRGAHAERAPEALGGHEVKTSPGSNDNHVHTAHFDAYGNGNTSFDNGHEHPVRAFVVSDFMDAMGIHMHSHPGLMQKPDADPSVPK